MISQYKIKKIITCLLVIFGIMCVTGLLLGFNPGYALGAAPASDVDNPTLATSSILQGVESSSAPCSGGPVIDGVTLDECVDNTFTVGGTSKTVRVWYTKVVSTVQRTVKGVTYNLTHYINSDTEAQDVAQWGREAWERYWQVFGRHPYDNGCGDRINVQLEDGIGWSGIAYWAGPGKCSIGIDSPMIRNGGGQGVVYHEFQHYMQYSYNDGCYGFLKPNYDADAEFVEGYADVAEDAVDATLDLGLYSNFVAAYDPETSFYDKGYNDVFNKYLSEQLGSQWASTDPQWHFDAVREHYEMCDAQDTLYVLDTLAPSLKSGLSEEELFLDFFAANWAKDWADPVSQPELVYFDDDTGPSYGSITLYKDENISSGTTSWTEQSTPDDWAARYYQVKPQSGCNYVTVKVDGAAGSHLGINLMAADTSAPTSVKRTAWIGENLSRTFPGFGKYDRIMAVVNAFDNKADYEVSFACVTPSLEIQEPRQANFVLVGDPGSPIAFLARFKVTTGGEPVLGLAESAFSAEAEGGVVTIVPGSLSQVSEEYWAILVPPIKPAGTTFVNLKICLDGSICDTETDALLYVDPGNTDFALVFDGSGSMSLEDTPGEGTRVENAKKAGTVLADLLRIGDRILVTDFSAHDIPVGCGLPWGDGNCALDIITRLSRINVVDPASNAIAATKTAISNITPREWTPIGAALQDAKNKLTAAPASENPKHIILLSDGDENVNPLYASVRGELIASGVIIDTIRFSADAPGDLLAMIAADTGGSYSYVPTLPGSLNDQGQSLQQLVDLLPQTSNASDLANRVINMYAQSLPQLLEQLTQMGIPPERTSQLMATTLPGPLGLDNVYDYYETRSQSAARLFHTNYLNIADGAEQTAEVYVDDSVNAIRFVVAGKQADAHLFDNCGYLRFVGIKPPGVLRPFEVSPANQLTPPDWDIRNSLYDDVVIISNPIPGMWTITTRYEYRLCANASEVPAQLETDFMINSSAESNIQLTARFLPPIVNNQGAAGDYVPIVATLLNRSGAMPGAIVAALIEIPGVADPYGLFLWDDGLHNDGSPGDGVYGNEFRSTFIGGNYNVRMAALFFDPANPAELMLREWNGSFFLTGVSSDDGDKDGMPDAWERRCGLDTFVNDAGLDLDQDAVPNIWELIFGTLPCQADTDRGGERDGSELLGNPIRNPLYAPDDLVRPLGHIEVEALNQRIRIQWTHAISYTNMVGWVGLDPEVFGRRFDMGNSGIYTVTDVVNGVPVYVRLAGQNGIPQGDYSDLIMIVPKADPDAPNGAVLINDGAVQTASKNVILSISADDTPLGGSADPASAGSGGPLALRYNEVSAEIEMRISNDPSFAGAVWEPLNPTKPWILAAGPPGIYTVYVQFRDAALNESLIVLDTIKYGSTSFLPFINKR